MEKSESEIDILFLMLQPREMIEEWGVQREDPQLFRQGLGIDSRSANLDVIHGIEDRIPDKIDDYDGIIMGGSAYCVYDDKKWIMKLEKLVKEIMVKSIPTLGVCFGHQIMIKALGGRILSDSPVYEVGAANIELTEQGRNDRLFEGMDSGFSIMSSHRDNVVTIPDHPKIKILAKSDLYPHQSTAIGDNMRTVQFHPEFDPTLVEKIIETNREKVIKDGIFKNERHLDNYIKRMKEKEEKIVTSGRKILNNFYNHFL